MMGFDMIVSSSKGPPAQHLQCSSQTRLAFSTELDLSLGEVSFSDPHWIGIVCFNAQRDPRY